MKRFSVSGGSATQKRNSASSLLATSLDTSLVCWQCTDLYTEPRQLPCGHSFCLACLQSACKGYQQKKPLQCPQGCPRSLYLQARRLEDLPGDDALRNKVKDARKMLNSVIDEEMTCLVHEKEAEAYCTNCNDLVCVKCMTSEDHRCHDFKQVENCEERMKQLTQQQITEATEKRAILERELEDVQTHLTTLLQKADDLQAQILENKRQSKVAFACEDPVRRFRKLQEILRFNAEQNFPPSDETPIAEEVSSHM